jgi:hypothetical protein
MSQAQVSFIVRVSQTYIRFINSYSNFLFKKHTIKFWIPIHKILGPPLYIPRRRHRKRVLISDLYGPGREAAPCQGSCGRRRRVHGSRTPSRGERRGRSGMAQWAGWLGIVSLDVSRGWAPAGAPAAVAGEHDCVPSLVRMHDRKTVAEDGRGGRRMWTRAC